LKIAPHRDGSPSHWTLHTELLKKGITSADGAGTKLMR